MFLCRARSYISSLCQLQADLQISASNHQEGKQTAVRCSLCSCFLLSSTFQAMVKFVLVSLSTPWQLGAQNPCLAWNECKLGLSIKETYTAVRFCEDGRQVSVLHFHLESSLV